LISAREIHENNQNLKTLFANYRVCRRPIPTYLTAEAVAEHSLPVHLQPGHSQVPYRFDFAVWNLDRAIAVHFEHRPVPGRMALP